jgi:hypothetical protein
MRCTAFRCLHCMRVVCYPDATSVAALVPPPRSCRALGAVYWSPCGTQVLFLTGWENDTEALRLLDVGPMILKHWFARFPHEQAGRWLMCSDYCCCGLQEVMMQE